MVLRHTSGGRRFLRRRVLTQLRRCALEQSAVKGSSHLTRLPGRQWYAIKALPADFRVVLRGGARGLRKDVVVVLGETVWRYRNTGRCSGGVEIHGEIAVAARLEVRKHRLHQGLLVPTQVDRQADWLPAGPIVDKAWFRELSS